MVDPVDPILSTVQVFKIVEIIILDYNVAAWIYHELC